MDRVPLRWRRSLFGLPGTSWRTALGLGLLTIVLYLPAIGWGAPTATGPDRIKTWATDEILPLEALAEMRNTFVESKPDRNYGYPWWHYFVTAAAQAPYLATLKATGGMGRAGAEFPYGLTDPVRTLRVLTLIGRLVSVLMAAGTVIAMYGLGAALFDRRVGLVTGLLTLLDYLMVYYGRTGNLDGPAMFYTAVGLAILARILAGGLTAFRAASLGAAAGLAMATKDQALLVFLPIAVALVFPRFAPAAKNRGRAVLVGLVASIVVYLIATGMVVDPSRHVTHVRALLFNPERVAPGAVYFPPAPRTLAGTLGLGLRYLGGLAAMITWPVTALAVLGAGFAIRRQPRLTVLLVPAVLLFFALELPTGVIVLRYLLPITVIAALFAAVGIMELGRRWSPVAALVALLVAFGDRAAIDVDLVQAQRRDNRYAAGQWIAEHYRPHERLEYFGVSDVLPPLPADLETRRVGNRDHWVGQSVDSATMMGYLAAERPEWIASIPDWTSGPALERSRDCPAEVCSALARGDAGYRIVARFPPCEFMPRMLGRPRLDHPSVCPPVTLFARTDVADRVDPR